MAPIYFFTGFPGFIATRIVKRLLEERPEGTYEMLVHPSQLTKARQTVEELGQGERFRLLTGDITVENLGLSSEVAAELRNSVTHVFHLAALYDLAVPHELAQRVNVTGTGHVNGWVRQLRRLERYVYFSTAYVSGDRRGRILETELEAGQSFKNHYESTKYEAERLVQALHGEEVPVTIIRPGIVMGDSQTGETAKFDGPYFVMRFLDRFARWPIPYVGAGRAAINLVPVDYVVRATVWLAHAEAGRGKVYHLTDPKPYRAKQVYAWICRELLGKPPRFTVPAAWVEALLGWTRFRRFVQVERETLAYFECPAEYDASAAKEDLAQAGIECPDLLAYLPQTVAFYRQHRADPERKIEVD